VEFDPANVLLPSDAPIPLAWGMDYDDAGLSRGIWIGSKRHWMGVAMDVVPVEPS
jgi:hypothetical protein